MSKRRIMVDIPEARDLIVEGPIEAGKVRYVVEREFPDVPTRVAGIARRAEVDDVAFQRTIANLPDAWEGKKCTVTLGKDELPEEIASYISGCTLGADEILGWFVSRWPEAFK